MDTLLLCISAGTLDLDHLNPVEEFKRSDLCSRFVNGVGVGTASAVTPLYISENAPRAIRGMLTGLYQLFIVTGVMIAFWYDSDQYSETRNFRIHI